MTNASIEGRSTQGIRRVRRSLVTSCEAGMALEAVQAQAGHRSIESTRIYLHLANGWLDDEYRRAMNALDMPTTAGEK